MKKMWTISLNKQPRGNGILTESGRTICKTKLKEREKGEEKEKEVVEGAEEEV